MDSPRRVFQQFRRRQATNPHDPREFRRRFGPRRIALPVAVLLIAVAWLAEKGTGAAETVQPPDRPSGILPTNYVHPDSTPSSAPLRLRRPEARNGVNPSGDHQIAGVGGQLGRPLIVQVVDAEGHPVEGVRVSYLVVSDTDDEVGPEGGLRTYPPSPLVSGENGFAAIENAWVEAVGLHHVIFFTDAARPAPEEVLTYTVEGRSRSWVNWVLVWLAGGMALFLLGAKLTGEGLGRLAGPRMRETMGKLDKFPPAGVGVGAVMTFLTQSSSASTTMFVSFAGAHALTMRQALPLIFGSAIGTTITVQLLAFDIYSFALLAVAAGVGMQLLLKPSRRTTAIGQGLLGFGLIFHGMHVMVQAVEPLRRLPWLSEALWAIKDHPGWALIFATLLTAAVQSSAAVLGLVLALARQDLITPIGAIPIIFGANIGTTITAFIASMGLTREARRVAVAHIVFKVLGVILFLPLMGVLAWLGVQATLLLTGQSPPLGAGGMARTVANIHTIFNVIIALIALPFTTQLESLVRKILPTKGSETLEGKLKYVDLPVLTSPALVFGAALREISRMGRFAEEQMKAAHEALFDRKEASIDYIHRRDDKIDNLQRSITRYLTDIMRSSDSPEETDRLLGLIQIVNDIENIGDILDNNVAHIARKMILNGLEFTPDSESELKDLFLRVATDLSTLFVAIATSDHETARTIRSHRHSLSDYSQKLLIRHLNRLQASQAEALDTSSIHMDLINYLQRIEFHIYRIAGIAAGEVTYHADDAARRES